MTPRPLGSLLKLVEAHRLVRVEDGTCLCVRAAKPRGLVVVAPRVQSSRAGGGGSGRDGTGGPVDPPPWTAASPRGSIPGDPRRQQSAGRGARSGAPRRPAGGRGRSPGPCRS